MLRYVCTCVICLFMCSSFYVLLSFPSCQHLLKQFKNKFGETIIKIYVFITGNIYINLFNTLSNKTIVTCVISSFMCSASYCVKNKFWETIIKIYVSITGNIYIHPFNTLSNTLRYLSTGGNPQTLNTCALAKVYESILIQIGILCTSNIFSNLLQRWQADNIDLYNFPRVAKNRWLREGNR